jgi:hypothetical protein
MVTGQRKLPRQTIEYHVQNDLEQAKLVDINRGQFEVFWLSHLCYDWSKFGGCLRGHLWDSTSADSESIPLQALIPKNPVSGRPISWLAATPMSGGSSQQRPKPR